MRVVFRCLPVILCVCLSAGEAAAREDLGTRALERSHAALQGESWMRALDEAELARRADPSRLAPTVAKALAYRGLGAHSVAHRLLESQEDGLQARGRGVERELLEEARRALDELRRTWNDPLGPAPDASPPEPGPSSVFRRLEAGPFESAATRAILEGRCEEAAALATEFIWWRPHFSRGRRIAGDAALCAGREREALLQYSAFIRLAGRDPRVLDKIVALGADRSTLVVLVERQEGAADPVLRLRAGGEWIEPTPGSQPPTFDGVPTREPLLLSVAGRGVEHREVPVQAPAPREVGRFELEVQPGRTALVTMPAEEEHAELRAAISAPGEGHYLFPGDRVEVPAGPVVVIVDGPHGRSRTPLVLPASSETAVRPSLLRPSSLRVLGLPGGADLRLHVPGEVELDGPRHVRVGAGALDPGSGVFLADPLKLRSIGPGATRLLISHPALGEGACRVEVEPGADAVVRVDPSALPGFAEVRRRWTERTKRLAEVRRDGALAAVFSAVAGFGAAAGALMAAGATPDSPLAPPKTPGWTKAGCGADGPCPPLLAGAVVGVGIGGALAPLAVGLADRATTRRAALGEWDPVGDRPAPPAEYLPGVCFGAAPPP